MPAVVFQIDDPAHGIDESPMGEGLREVAQVPAARRLDSLGVGVQGTGKGQQLLARLVGPLSLPDDGQHRPGRRSRW
jgi:hypothetical protein